jgi:MscS family membrane protein
MIRTIRVLLRALGSHARLRSGRALRVLLPLGVMLVALVGAYPAAAAPPTAARPAPANKEDETPPEPEAEPEPEAAPDSPQASLRTFLELCRAGDYEGAAGFLELPRDSADHGHELARRLEAVLDRRLPFELATLSPASTGTRDDDLPRNVDEIGTIELDDGTVEPVTLVKRFRPEPRWVFSKATVARIDTWYAQLENYWLLANLPPVLLTPGPRGVPWWQWIALPLLVCGAGIVGWLLARAGRLVVSGFVRKLDRPLLGQITRPFSVIWALAIIYTTLPFLGVHSRIESVVYGGLRTAFLVVVFWVLVSLLDLSCSLVMRSAWAVTHPSGSALVPLARRIAKVALVAIVLVAVFAELGYPVASMIAGLGIGGLVVALAAQKTVENLFGAFAIGADQPFLEGDYVRIEGFEGTVEVIGLRSTRFRTLERTLVTVPNGKLADMRIETLTARDRMRVACILGLVYETTTEQLRAVLEGWEGLLRAHPKIWTENVIVRLKALGASSLDIEVMAWFQTTDPNELGRIEQEVLIGFREVVQAAGTAFAFPTQTVHLESVIEPRPAASAPA